MSVPTHNGKWPKDMTDKEYAKYLRLAGNHVLVRSAGPLPVMPAGTKFAPPSVKRKMTHIEAIRELTRNADASREGAVAFRSKAREQRNAAAECETAADKLDLEAMAYEDSIDALQALSTMEATA